MQKSVLRGCPKCDYSRRRAGARLDWIESKGRGLPDKKRPGVAPSKKAHASACPLSEQRLQALSQFEVARRRDAFLDELKALALKEAARDPTQRQLQNSEGKLALEVASRVAVAEKKRSAGAPSTASAPAKRPARMKDVIDLTHL